MKRFSGRRVRRGWRALSDDELGRLVMENLGNSMGASFFDTSGVEQLAREEEEAVPAGFFESPEYASALAAYKKRTANL
ncbi:MAG TPA: hypothetical protein O0X70_00390 [Methanocorpusculum sp.]|nr:hypothetical protein [Methanocorpusculum sp.]